MSNTTSSGDKYQDGARAAAELLGKVYIPPQFEREYETQLVLDPAEYAAGAEVAKQLAPFTQHPR